MWVLDSQSYPSSESDNLRLQSCFAAEFLKAGAQELCLSGKRTLHWSEDMKAVIKAPERASVLIQDIKTSHVSSTALSRTAVVWHRLVPAHVE